MRRHGWRRPRLLAALIATLGLLLGVWAAPGGRAAVQTVLLLPSLFASAPIDPLRWATAPPTRISEQFAFAAGQVDLDLYHPVGEGQHGAILLQYQGPRPVPRDDPNLVRFAEGLARTGVVVLVPESSTFTAGRVVAEEREAVVLAFQRLLAEPTVDPSRAGIIGFSVGGSISLVAAAEEPAIRDRVRFVNTLGSYFDAEELLVDAASRSQVAGGQIVPWQPDPQALDILAVALLEAAAGEGAEAVNAFATAILAGTGTRTEAVDLLERLPLAARTRLDLISPSRVLGQLRARLYLMHDVDDGYVPFGQETDLADAAGPRLARATRFAIFSHVQPDRPVPWQTFLPDLWRLAVHAQAVMSELQ